MPREAPVPQSRGARSPQTPQGAFAFLGDTGTRREPISLATVDADLMKDAIQRWTDLGHAITIGRTSDGGAVAISLLAGGQRRSKYFSDLSELEDFLTSVRVAV